MNNLERLDENDVAALIVFYNPTDDSVENLLSYFKTVSRIYIFDNSEIPNHVAYNKIRAVCGGKVYIHINNRNDGIGVALNRGLEWAIRDGFKWVLTMDQDSSFYNDIFFDRVKNYLNKENVAIFSPNQSLTLKGSTIDEIMIIDEMVVMTSGNLLNVELYKQIGPFNEDLFIDEIDHDYCLRAKRSGFHILKFDNIGINHNLGTPLVIKGVGRKPHIISQHSPIRVYYITRNNLFIFKKYFFSYPRFVISRAINLVVFFKNIFIYQDDKWKKIGFGIKGSFHFLIGRYGKL